jgi:hypothetical protein
LSGTLLTNCVIINSKNFPFSCSFFQTLEEREWFAQKFEETRYDPVPPERKVALAKLMLKCQAYDHFLASKFPTVKRYGGEGAESMMTFFDEVFSSAAQGMSSTRNYDNCQLVNSSFLLYSFLTPVPVLLLNPNWYYMLETFVADEIEW